MPGRTTSTPKKEKSKKEIQTILEQSVDGWMKVGKKVIGKNLSPILAEKEDEKEDNVTGTGDLKRTISGKTPGPPDSLLTQTSVLELGEAAFSPPRKRFSSDSSAAESELSDLDVFDKHANGQQQHCTLGQSQFMLSSYIVSRNTITLKSYCSLSRPTYFRYDFFMI